MIRLQYFLGDYSFCILFLLPHIYKWWKNLTYHITISFYHKDSYLYIRIKSNNSLVSILESSNTRARTEELWLQLGVQQSTPKPAKPSQFYVNFHLREITTRFFQPSQDIAKVMGSCSFSFSFLFFYIYFWEMEMARWANANNRPSSKNELFSTHLIPQRMGT